MDKLDNAIKNVSYILDCLVAYRDLIGLGDCNNCKYKNACNLKPAPGEFVRINCPYYEGKGKE